MVPDIHDLSFKKTVFLKDRKHFFLITFEPSEPFELREYPSVPTILHSAKKAKYQHSEHIFDYWYDSFG
jgi:hypothetical protein